MWYDIQVAKVQPFRQQMEGIECVQKKYRCI